MGKKKKVTIDDLVGGAIVPESCRVREEDDGLYLSLYHTHEGYISYLLYDQGKNILFVDMVMTKEDIELTEGEGILLSFRIPDDTKAVKARYFREVDSFPKYDRRWKKHPYLKDGRAEIEYR